MSSMQVSSGRPHMLRSHQRGRGNDPVVVLGRIRLAVAVNMASSRPGIIRPPIMHVSESSTDWARANKPRSTGAAKGLFYAMGSTPWVHVEKEDVRLKPP